MAENVRKELVQHITRNLLDIQILRLVQTQPLWGYKIKKQVEALFGVRVRHSVLYPLLKTLELKGLLVSERQQSEGRTRKVYTITSKGRRYLSIYDSLLREQLERRDIK